MMFIIVSEAISGKIRHFRPKLGVASSGFAHLATLAPVLQVQV